MLRKLLFSLLFLATLVALAIWATWPLVTHARVAIPTSQGHLGTVPLLNAWIIWWNAESLAHGLTNYWDAPIFFPTKGTLAFSEPQPATLLLAPLVWSCRASLVAYNLYLLASIVLNGWFARRLLIQLRCAQLTACCGGVAMALHPLAWQNLEAIQLFPLWGSLWTISNLIQLLRRPTWRAGLWTGVAFASTATTSVHHSLFLALILIFALPITIVSPLLLARLLQLTSQVSPRGARAASGLRRLPGIATAGLLAVVTAGCLLLPLLGPMERVHRQHELHRSSDLVASLSATLASWTSAPANSLICHWLRTSDPTPAFPEPLLPGVLSSLLVLTGLAFWPGRRSVACIALPLLLSTALVSFILSFGPGLGSNDWNVWTWATDWLSPLSRIRSPYRFAYFTQMALILAACLVADHWQIRCRLSGNWPAKFASMAATASLVVLACENTPSQVRLVFPPILGASSTIQEESWMNFLQRYEPATALLCLPIAASDAESAQETEARWMVCATQHRVPLLNGYSGYTPAEWQTLSRQIRRNGLSEQVLQRIQETGANLIVVRKDSSSLPENHRLTLIFDSTHTQIWQIP